MWRLCYDVGPNYLVMELVEGPTLGWPIGLIFRVLGHHIPTQQCLGHGIDLVAWDALGLGKVYVCIG